MPRSLSRKPRLPLAPNPEESYFVSPLFTNTAFNLLCAHVIVPAMIPYAKKPFTKIFLPFFVCVVSLDEQALCASGTAALAGPGR